MTNDTERNENDFSITIDDIIDYGKIIKLYNYMEEKYDSHDFYTCEDICIDIPDYYKIINIETIKKAIECGYKPKNSFLIICIFDDLINENLLNRSRKDCNEVDEMNDVYLNDILWLKENGFVLDEGVFKCAAEFGHLENMKWLKTNGCKWNEEVFERASFHGNLRNMKWLLRNGCPWDEETFMWAVYDEDIENMDWLKKNGCPINYKELCESSNTTPRIIEWLKNNGCPEHYIKMCKNVVNKKD